MGEFQLFLHIFGAIALFGATATVAVMAFAGRSRPDGPLAKASFATTVAVAIPAWVVTLGFGYWTESEQGWPDGIGWIDMGAGIADLGLFVLLGAAGLSYAWMRRPTGGRVVTALGVLTALYLVALAAAWWAMSAKVPS